MTRKRDLNNLAIYGGDPAFQEKLHVGCPNIGNREDLFTRINDLLDRRWLTNNGPFAQEFEQRIADKIGVKHCVAVCNGTLGLEITARAMGLTGEVIVPAMTFVATAHALQWQRITPVFCDIAPGSHNLDPQCVERMITPRTTGIMGVHLWGQPCEIEALTDVARRHNLKLLFDAAHAFGCSYNGQMIGNFGDAEVFSFHATKFLNSLEGGAIVTNNDELAAKLRSMRNFGFVEHDHVAYIGTNGKMNEISAAMGLTSLASMDEFIAANYRNYKQYQDELAGTPGVNLIAYDELENCNYQYIILEIDKTTAGISRDELVNILLAENIMARPYFNPGCHKMEPYRSDPFYAGLRLPETERVVQRTMGLPTGTAIGPGEVSQICQIIRMVVAHRR